MVAAAGVTLVGLAVVVYFVYDPAANAVFPKCPFLMVTGWQCPGCGSQRAIHHLLHGNVASAWTVNPLLVVSIPYLMVGFGIEPLRKKYLWAETVRERFYGQTAAWIALAVMIAYTILRNIL